MNKWKYSPDYGDQTDWNQTFVTALNVVCLSKGVENNSINVRVPDKFKPLIESLVFFDKNTGKISNKYNVEFTESKDNKVYVERHELEIVIK